MKKKNPGIKTVSAVPLLFKRPHKLFGRNTSGKITIRHRGGGWKKKYKFLDLKRHIWNVPARIISIERSNYHSAYIAAIVYTIGIATYILASRGMIPGDLILSSDAAPNLPGNLKSLRYMPLHRKISSVESYPGSGAVYLRSAGTWAVVLNKGTKFATLLFNSGLRKKLPLDCAAVVGASSNPLHRRFQYNSAGAKRRFGWRPTVRGVAMNPIDHPHGGGRGKKSPPNPNYNFSRRLPKGRRTAKIF